MKRLLFTLLTLASVLPVVAFPQENYPSRQVLLVSPEPETLFSSQIARNVDLVLTRILKSSVRTLNKVPYRDGILSVLNSKPDGHTLLFTSSNFSIIPLTEELFDREPYYSLDQFVPIALLSAEPFVLVVNAGKPWKSLGELVQDAKRRPGEISFAAVEYGNIHLAVENISLAADIQLKYVPSYGTQERERIFSGKVDAWAAFPSVILPYIKEGKLRPLAVGGANRIAPLPSVPTLKEQGYDIELYNWAGLFAPKGVSDSILRILGSAMREVIGHPLFRERMMRKGYPVVYLGAPDFQEFLYREEKMLSDAVERISKIEKK